MIGESLQELNPSRILKTEKLFSKVVSNDLKCAARKLCPNGLLTPLGASNNEDCFIISAFLRISNLIFVKY